MKKSTAIILAASGALLINNVRAAAISNVAPPTSYPDVKKPTKKQFKNAQELKTQTPMANNNP